MTVDDDKSFLPNKIFMNMVDNSKWKLMIQMKIVDGKCRYRRTSIIQTCRERVFISDIWESA